MTKVINLLGGPGVGKSSIAALIYGKMKLQGYNVELAREVAKDWAWEGRIPGTYDQTYLFGAQSRVESRLYGKVDYIISESPLILSAIYELFYFEDSIIEPSIVKYLTKVKKNGILHSNYLLSRKEGYENTGRHQTEDEAKTIDTSIVDFLNKHEYEYIRVTSSIDNRVDDIIEDFLND